MSEARQIQVNVTNSISAGGCICHPEKNRLLGLYRVYEIVFPHSLGGGWVVRLCQECKEELIAQLPSDKDDDSQLPKACPETPSQVV
jgi:hypothetical protein